MSATDKFPVETLLKHVGCGTIDNMGMCILCQFIRARLQQGLFSGAKVRISAKLLQDIHDMPDHQTEVFGLVGIQDDKDEPGCKILMFNKIRKDT